MNSIPTLAVTAMLFIAGCKQNSESTPIVVTINDFERMINMPEEKIILDVRTPEEYASGHLSNSILINIKDPDFTERIDSLDKSKPVFVYCASGVRSGKAADILTMAGFENVYLMDKGLKKWAEEKKPITK